jgi:hypothetical protein
LVQEPEGRHFTGYKPEADHQFHEDFSGCRPQHPRNSAQHLYRSSSEIPDPTSTVYQPCCAREQAQKEVIPVSSGQKDGSCSGTKRASTEEAPDNEEAKVTSTDKAEAPANDAIVFPAVFGDPSDIHSTPKAYAIKFFNKLTEAEKWDLEHDLLNAMLQNAWGKSDAQSSEIEQFKIKTCEFLDDFLCKPKVNHSPSSPKYLGGNQN